MTTNWREAALILAIYLGQAAVEDGISLALKYRAVVAKTGQDPFDDIGTHLALLAVRERMEATR